MDIIGKTNNFHELWCFEISRPCEAIVPEIMEIMEIIGLTPISHGFVTIFRETLMFSQRSFAATLVFQCV